MESLVLEGLVEAIIFKSEDTGYTVAKITANKELITIVGVMPLLQEGQQIEVKGKFIQHKQFGRQFSVEEYKAIQEFPTEWVICGPILEQYKQIGNAVPIKLGEAKGNLV